MWFKQISVIILLISSTFGWNLPVSNDDVEENNFPNNTIPLYYEVELETKLHEDSMVEFGGTVRLKVRVMEQSSTITLHHHELTILKIDFFRENGVSLQSNVSFTMHETGFLEINPRLPVAEGLTIFIVISYTGSLRTDQAGFYRSFESETMKRNDRLLSMHQLESVDATHAFPNYEKPELGTDCIFSVRHHKEYTLVTNLKVEEKLIEEDDEFVLTKFEEVSLTQTYLIVFLVSDFTFDDTKRL